MDFLAYFLLAKITVQNKSPHRRDKIAEYEKGDGE